VKEQGGYQHFLIKIIITTVRLKMVNILPINNPLFIVANVLLLISYTTTKILYLRITLALASLFYALWGAVILNFALDTFIFNMIFFCINSFQAGLILYNKRNIKFSPELEEIYTKVFGPNRYNLNRAEFLQLAKAGFIRNIKKDRFYAQKDDNCTNLSVIISGVVSVTLPTTDGEIEINKARKNQFLDSPEFIANPDGGQFCVNIKAIEEVTYFTWPREVLVPILRKNTNLQFALNAVLSIDLAALIYRENLVICENSSRITKQVVESTFFNDALQSPS